ncbi:MAG: AbrB/MazE/SpoVT family DNA-binding domain-containing protein [Candidatus Aenigmarchaeota archaeon]|nr:AbrB/MazE/SpoVT family DNA-binding domain-containing protein [Candidatus Aenigmarchaeota archaeon]
MEGMEAKVRKWGRSIGIVIPVEIAEKEKIKVNDNVEIFIRKKSNAIRETFGTLRLKEPTEKILKEIDKDLWHD